MDSQIYQFVSFVVFPLFFNSICQDLSSASSKMMSLSRFHQHALISQSAGGNPTFLTDYFFKVYSEPCSSVRLTWHDTSLFIPPGCPSDQKPNVRHVGLLVTWHDSQVWKLSQIKVGLWGRLVCWISTSSRVISFITQVPAIELSMERWNCMNEYGKLHAMHWVMSWIVLFDIRAICRLSLSIKRWMTDIVPKKEMDHVHTPKHNVAYAQSYSFIRASPRTWFIHNGLIRYTPLVLQ